MKTASGCALGLVLAAAHVVPSAHAQATACATRAGGDGPRIEEARFVPLGGIEQYITIRGDDRTNPVLLHVHGGPGIAFSAFPADFAPYEADFTVVQWDQRGAGCTFGRNGEGPGLTLDRLAGDGVELARHLRGRLGGTKIVVVGHSFGSIVATEMVRRAPEEFSLYVGTGQFGSFARNLESQIVHLRTSAAGDADLLAQLDAIAALDSRSAQKFGAVTRLVQSRMPAVDVAFMQGLQARAAAVRDAQALADWHAGRRASGAGLIQQVAGVDLFVSAPRLAVPFVVIQGSDDDITPADAARVYFDRLEAPAKNFVVVEGAGHFAHLTHTQQFLAALRAHALGLIPR